MEKILVTGGGGYIGAELTKALLFSGFQVRVLDLFIYGRQVLNEHPRLEVLEGDIRSLEMVKKSLKGIDVVFHLASVSNDPGYEMDPKIGYEINYGSLDPFIKAAINSKVTRFIFPSSCSIYGKGSNDILSESDNIQPLTNYSLCKAKCEDLLKSYASDKFYVTIFRPATVCGKSDRQRFDLTVNQFTKDIFYKDLISVGNKENIRPSLHIKDMIRAYIMAIQNNNRRLSGNVYNLAYENFTLKHIVHTIAETMNKNVQIQYTASNDERSYKIGAEKIKRDWGFTPTFGFCDAVRELVTGFKGKEFIDPLNNPFYYNKIMQKKLGLFNTDSYE